MQFTTIELTNWKNFKQIATDLPERAFLIGPNASGKSNFLDAFRFLRDASSTGGIQQAVQDRGGLEKIRSLHARNPSDVMIRVELKDDTEVWSYSLAFSRRGTYPRKGAVVVKQEWVSHNGSVLLQRPNAEDAQDDRLLEQTYLEQISKNGAFRAIADHFREIAYLHLVPQFMRGTRLGTSEGGFPDMYGGRFMEKVAMTQKAKRERYLKKIQDLMKIAVPQLTELAYVQDARGLPHLEARYAHWRPNAGRQNETQFSDGTLRLIALLWMLQEEGELVLLEEPELSLHPGIVQQLAPFIYKAQTRGKKTRQALISTHSMDLLSDPGIAPEEILLLRPTHDGTTIISGASSEDIREAMRAGLTAAEAALPHTHEPGFQQISLFEL